MKEETKKDSLKRLNYLIGHLQGVKKMLEEDRYCIEIIQQNQGVIAAIRKVNENILEEHFETCVSDAIKKGSEKEREKVLEELMEVFKRTK